MCFVHLSRTTSLASNLCSHRIQSLILKAQLRVAPKYLLCSIRYTFSATSLRPPRSLDRRDLLSSPEIPQSLSWRDGPCIRPPIFGKQVMHIDKTCYTHLH